MLLNVNYDKAARIPTYIVSSTLYAVLILALVQFHTIDIPTLILEAGTLNFGALISLVISEFGISP